MSSVSKNPIQEEWLKILGKGMVTIPKQWRDELGIKTGDVIKAKKEGTKIIIESTLPAAPYRIYTASEIDKFVKDDTISPALTKKVKAYIARSK